VLVVDDDGILGVVIRRSLSAEHDAEVVTSADAALARVSSGDHFDVIVCDLMMPVVTGMDLHARLAALGPELADRMVFMTGGAFTARARAFLDHVPNARLEKPFDLKELRALVNGRIL
jgi:CheY-like chemotaxis protein